MVRRKRFRKSLKKLLPAVTVTLTTVPFAAWAPPAQAFFPPLWGTNPPVAVVPPTVIASPPSSLPPLVVAPPVSPPPFVPPPPPAIVVSPPAAPPPLIVSPPPMPNCVPEPATLVSGLIGLAAAAGYGLKRRHEKKSDEPNGV